MTVRWWLRVGCNETAAHRYDRTAGWSVIPLRTRYPRSFRTVRP